MFYYVLLLKLVCLFLEILIIWKYDMNFLGCNPKRPYEAGLVIGLVDLILNCPIDYSPFY